MANEKLIDKGYPQMSLNKQTMDLYSKHYGQLVGKKIKGLAYDGQQTFGLIFSDGTVAWISQDEEGNGPGFLHIEKPTKK